MFGLRFKKFEPREYVLAYKNGQVVREGAGLSFVFYAPTTSVAKIPLSSMELPFMYNEISADFQTVSVQGQVACRVIEPKQIAEMMDYTLDGKCQNYISEDPSKLPNKIISILRVLMKKVIEDYTMQEAITGSDKISVKVLKELKNNNEIEQFGIEVIGLSILALLPSKETVRALETKAREEILKNADESIYERRNASILQERRVKENEFNTEISVENKKQQILEKQLETERFAQEKQNQMTDEQLIFDTVMEEKRQKLIDLSVANTKAEADASAYTLAAVLKSLEDTDKNVLEILAKMDMKPEKLIAVAFGEMASNAEKIGQLNINPDLLKEIMKG